LLILDVARPGAPRELARLATCDASAVRVQWPYAYVADGPGGLWIVDVRVPIAPRVAAAVAPALAEGEPADVRRVEVLFQHSTPRIRGSGASQQEDRSPARLLAALLDRRAGPVLLDVTEPGRVRQLSPDPKRRPRASRQRGTWQGLALASHVDLAQPQGGARTTERDLVWALELRGEGDGAQSTVHVLDATDPERPKRLSQRQAGARAEQLVLARFYTTPFLKTMLLLPGRDGVALVDASVSAEPVDTGFLARIPAARAIAVEEFPLDRMLDEQGRPQKDVSHRDSRWLRLSEIGRVLDVPAAALALPAAVDALPRSLGWIAAGEFARLDADRSGRLEGRELGGAAAGCDTDGDSRVLLAEYAARHGVARTESEREAVASLPSPEAALAEGPIGRLLDRLEPARFDLDQDARLAPAELRAAWFAALELDGDGALSLGELSREPGARDLRFDDELARVAFRRRDVDGNGRIQPPELRVPPNVLAALDADRDGAIQLEIVPGSRAARAGVEYRPLEWPRRQTTRFPLAPEPSLERLLAAFDADGDGVLARSELAARPDLFALLDQDGDGKVPQADVQNVLDTIAARGVDCVVDGFLARWDLDGDGRVDGREIPLPSWLAPRILDARTSR
jgi:Ca2+-binding EF-hand superfamily protein